MDFIKIKNLLIEHFGQDVIAKEDLNGQQAALFIQPESILGTCRFLHDHPDTWFDFLSCLSAVDLGQGNGFQVVYHLVSIPHNLQLTLKVDLPDNRSDEQLPTVDSVSSVWQTADWHEREAFDLVGIFFNRHPDLRRILLPDDWQGYPLRKDYQDAETYHGIPIK